MNVSKFSKFFDFTNCQRIASIQKTHGVNGHLKAHFFISSKALKSSWVFVNIEGFLVPFSIDSESSSFKNENVILKFHQINSIEKAQIFVKKDLYAPHFYLKDILKNIIDFENFVVGYNFSIPHKNVTGTVESVNTSSAIPLMIVNVKNKSYLLPSNSIEVLKIDVENKSLEINILTDLFPL